jgi:L-histidine N-alpha-methyltransferase
MPEPALPAPVIEVNSTAEEAACALREDVRAGLAAEPKSLPPKWFYDAAGSALFERITAQEEYYPFRAETEVLETRAAEIAELSEAASLVELGSGSSEKTRLLLDALRRSGSLAEFVALDVSESALRDALESIASEYPALRVHGMVDDFTPRLGALPGRSPRLVAFLGGTIGNLFPAERHEFLASVREVLAGGEWLLVGTDLIKDAGTLVRAYDDAAGVTAEFNRNVLRVLNRELGAEFPVAEFEHVAVFDAERCRVEMRLRAPRAMRVRIAALESAVDFAAGEEVRTEISTKFRREQVTRELAAAGFDLAACWSDEAGRYAVNLARAAA